MQSILKIIFGFIFLIKGADLLVEGSSNIARKFKISEFIIGLTIVAVGTSLPELVVSIQFTIKQQHSLLMGNIIGSCIYNLLLILGIISIMKPIKIKIKQESNIIIMLFAILIVQLFGNIYGLINKTEGIMLILFFLIFMISTLIQNKEEKTIKNNSLIKAILILIAGIVLLKLGGDFVVDSASNIARRFKIDERIIGITIVSVGTSLPELITSIIAVKKENSQMAIGNIIGSNIFNLLLVLGITSLIKPIKFLNQYNIDLIFLAIITLFIILSSIKSGNEKIKKREGIILIVMFALYNIKLFIN